MSVTLIDMHRDLAEIVFKLLPDLHSPTLYERVGQYLYDWQTLISGLLALGAAVVTVNHLRSQIRIERSRIKDERERAEKGAKIRIAHALSPLSVYGESGIAYWASWARTENEAPYPKLPYAAIDTLMEVAVDIDNETFESIRELVLWTQVLDARVSGYLSKDIPPPINWRENMIFELLYFKCLVNRLYAYGRGKTQVLPFVEPTRTQLEQAFPSMLPRGVSPEREKELLLEVKSSLDTHCRTPE
ncbi:hypothetical protein [Brucella intermedia]|uniref:hypothetical protein n=1 Tax=Brucella intermedia TaxID=94625 RepID=UPI00159287F5|nr:hypothetical protein [Brucella intermedia]